MRAKLYFPQFTVCYSVKEILLRSFHLLTRILRACEIKQFVQSCRTIKTMEAHLPDLYVLYKHTWQGIFRTKILSS